MGIYVGVSIYIDGDEYDEADFEGPDAIADAGRWLQNAVDNDSALEGDDRG